MMDFGGVKRRDKKLKLLLIGAGILIVLLAALAGFLLWQFNNSKTNDNEAKSNQIISQVDELFILPRGEEPTVAEIQDLDKLKGQEFFVNAKDGDFVLIYSKAKVAFLYRESEGKLINVGPIKTEENATDPQTTE